MTMSKFLGNLKKKKKKEKKKEKKRAAFSFHLVTKIQAS